MMDRIQLGALVIIVALIWVVTAFFRGGSIELVHIISFGTVVTATPLALFLFDRWVWKWPLVQQFIARRPNIDGTWKVVLHSSYRTEEHPDGVITPGILVIRQRFADLTARLYTKESSSSSISKRILEIEEGLFQLSYTYQNDPQTLLRGDRSEIHYGAAVLQFLGINPSSGSGEYWTDRLSKGALILSDRTDGYASDFSSGEALFDE